MILIADEDVPRSVTEYLLNRGHEVKLRFRSAGRPSLRCSQARAQMRLAQVIDLIEFEYTRRQALQDKRLIVDVKDSNIVFQG